MGDQAQGRASHGPAAGAQRAGRRLEGRAKVTGRAAFIDDLREEALGFSFATAVPVTSSVARGRIRRIEAAAALAVPGVRLVMTHASAPRLRKVTSLSMAEAGERLPLQDDRVCWHGECVALVVADTLLAAREAARLVVVEYEPDTAPLAVTLDDAEDRLKPVKRAGIAPGRVARGAAEAAHARADIQLEAEYRTAPYHHNAIEPSAVIARWDEDGGVTIHAAVQWHHVDALAIGQAFGLGLADGLVGFARRKLLGQAFAGKVRLVNHLAGGAFGRNLAMVHLFLAPMAARLAGCAVKVVLDTRDTFSLLSYRGEVRQRLRLGATRDGRLTSLVVEADVAVGAAGQYVEPVGSWSCQIYAQPAHLLRHRVARLDLNGTGWMRAPGGASAMFALESAMDELARRLAMDPLDLRLLNHADRDPESGKPWTSKHLRACYEAGANAIGWRTRPRGGAPRASDGRLTGYGMATSYESCFRFPASVAVELGREGRAVVAATVAEMGQGAWTGLHGLAAEALGLAPGDVALETDRTELPAGAGAIASTGVHSNGQSLLAAAASVRADLLGFAVRDPASPLHGLPPESLTIAEGIVRGPGNRAESVREIMARHPAGTIRKTATTGRDFGRSRTKKATFGAVFAEVSVDPLTLHVRIERLVGAFDCGQILQPRLARSQLVGGMIWGLGHALFEATHVDRRSGRWTNANLAEALVATQADVPPSIEVITVGEGVRAPGEPLYLKGVSEIGVIGTAPAIANAIFDATGLRLRDLPLRIDGRLAAAPPGTRSALEAA
jgi:xanthine dehydrogenase YagR molybdenum-binding subunit